MGSRCTSRHRNKCQQALEMACLSVLKPHVTKSLTIGERQQVTWKRTELRLTFQEKTR